MPDFEFLSTQLKAGSRNIIFSKITKSLSLNGSGAFIVSLFFVVLVTAISEAQFRLLDVNNVISLYLDQIAAGVFHSLGRFFNLFSPVRAVFTAAIFLLVVVIRVGFMSYCMRAVRGQRTSILDTLDGLLIPGKILLIYLLSTILILLWSLLLVVPGVIAFYQYRQSYYILLDDPSKSALQCIRESKILMNGHKLELLSIDFSFFAWLLLSVAFALLTRAFLPFSVPLISIWTSPYIGLSHSAYYDRLLRAATS